MIDSNNSVGKELYLFKPNRELAAGPDTTRKDLFSELGGKKPKGYKIVTVPPGTVVVQGERPENLAEDAPYNQYYVLRDNPELRGTDIKNPEQASDPTTNEPIVTMDFTGSGRKKFHDVTRRLAQRGQASQIPGQPPSASFQTFAVVLDGKIVTRPYIDYSENPDGIDGRTGAQISGSFTIQSAQDLAEFLKIGALPIKLKLDQPDAGLGSARQAGSEPGPRRGDRRPHRGFAVPARVLQVAGRDRRSRALHVRRSVLRADQVDTDHADAAGDRGVDPDDRGRGGLEHRHIRAHQGRVACRAQHCVRDPAGYSRGISTIIDANVVTLITAFILFILATSGVKGFAFTLGVGTIVSLLTAVLFTQAVLGSMGRSKLLNSPAMLGAGKRHIAWNFDFIGKSRFFFAMSGCILAIGSLALAINGLNFGIDFESGTRVTTSLARSSNVEEVRDSLSPLGLSDAKIQQVTDPELGPNVFQISTHQLEPSGVAKVQNRLDDKFGISPDGFSSTSVGPTFGSTVAKSALYAIIFSLIAIMGYVALRFSPKFAVPVLIALFHDLLITAGVYALVDREVTTSTVAALLTILGFSLYDTVIVFDRIRENAPRMPRAAFSQIVNRSMSEVLTRSLATSASTLIPVTALLLFGGQTLKDFAFALLVGIASGTYSSIFIASPVLSAWKEREAVYVQRRHRILEDVGMVPAFAVATVGGLPAQTARPDGVGRAMEPSPDGGDGDGFEQQQPVADELEQERAPARRGGAGGREGSRARR